MESSIEEFIRIARLEWSSGVMVGGDVCPPSSDLGRCGDLEAFRFKVVREETIPAPAGIAECTPGIDLGFLGANICHSFVNYISTSFPYPW